MTAETMGRAMGAIAGRLIGDAPGVGPHRHYDPDKMHPASRTFCCVGYHQHFSSFSGLFHLPPGEGGNFTAPPLSIRSSYLILGIEIMKPSSKSP